MDPELKPPQEDQKGSDQEEVDEALEEPTEASNSGYDNNDRLLSAEDLDDAEQNPEVTSDDTTEETTVVEGQVGKGYTKQNKKRNLILRILGRQNRIFLISGSA